MNPGSVQPLPPWGPATGWQPPKGAPGMNGGLPASNILQATGSFSPQFGEPALHLQPPGLEMPAPVSAIPEMPPQPSLVPTAGSDTFTPEATVPESIPLKAAAAADNDRAAMNIFRVVKLLIGGAGLAYFSSKFTNVKFANIFAIELFTGIAELFLTQKILDAKNPVTQKIMEMSNRLAHGPEKPVTDMTPAEKHHSFVPISTLVTVISGLVNGVTTYLQRDVIDFAKEKAQLNTKRQELKEVLPFFKKLVTRAEVLGRELLACKPVHFFRSNPKYIIPISVVTAGIYGFAEGEAAQYLIKLYKKFTGQAVNPELILD